MWPQDCIRSADAFVHPAMFLSSLMQKIARDILYAGKIMIIMDLIVLGLGLLHGPNALYF